VKLADDAGPLLRRPFSISGVANGTLTLLFKQVGELTHELAGLRAGDRVDVLGPLGHGYDLSFAPVDRAFLIGGGYGVAPLLLLARALHEQKLAGEIHLLAGARSAQHVLWRDELGRERSWLKAGFATDDGSEGFKGTVLDFLADRMGKGTGSTRLFGCGPMPMLGAMAKRWPDLPYQAAVENQMGCGIGVCMGCVLPVIGGSSAYERYSRICVDGPVFDGRRIDWDAIT
jgi:dihydroorotate dehydrogenase electron transfer subunit